MPNQAEVVLAYFRKIAEAESCLSRGDLLGAETLLEEARELHAKSRFRAPVVEQALDPLLRVGRRLMRRPGQGPVLPNFPARAERLEEDLRRLAARRSREASDLVLVEEAQLLPEHRRACESFLLLHRESCILHLPRAIVWSLLRLYLESARGAFDGVEAELVPAVFDVPEDERGWLVEWIQFWLIQSETRSPRVATAILSWCEHFAEDSTSSEAAAGVWCWLASRLAVVGPVDGPRALRWGRLALDLPLPDDQAWSNLRLVASLECNQGLLATPGVGLARTLARLGRHPAASSREWPPRDLEELLRVRDPDPQQPGVVVAQPSGDGRRLLLVRTYRERPVDAVFLELVDAERGGEDEPMRVSPARGREAVEAWLHPGDILLAPGREGDALEAFLPPEKLLAVEELEAVFPASPRALPPPAAATHPLFQTGRDQGEWTPLYAAARELLPRARARLGSEALRSEWGRANLRKLASVGLRRCQLVERVLEIVEPLAAGDTGDVGLQHLPLEPALCWPVLSERPWLERGEEVAAAEAGLDADLVIANRPSLEELASEALALGSVMVLSPEAARLRELTARLAATVDPRRVTWQRHLASCPRPELECLARWIDEAVSRQERELDVLWLYQGLCAAPEAAVGAGLDSEQRSAAWDELLRAREDAMQGTECDARCPLHDHPSGCWPQQLEERRRLGQVWAGDLRVTEAAPGECVLVDDLTGWMGGPDDRVVDDLKNLRRRLAQSRCFLVHADAGPFGESLGAALAPWLPAARRPLPHTRAWTRSVDLLAVPAGYAPGSGLLSAESELLLEERLRLWDEEVGASPRWSPEASEAAGEVAGRAEAPESKIVLVPRLGHPGELPGLIQLLRLALASTHTSETLVCLDPRLAEAHPQLTRRVHLPTSLGLGARALASGAEVFSSRRVRTPATWKRPITESRLLEVGAPQGLSEARVRAVARALEPWSENPRLALAAATDAERAAIARLLLRLARASRDGAGLGIRRVVWVGEGEPPFEAASDVEVLDPRDGAVPREETRGIVVAPPDLARVRETAWAAQLSDGVWLLANAELHLGDGVLAQGRALPPLAAGTRVLAFHDDPASPEVAAAVDALAVEVPIRGGKWTWIRHRAPDHQVRCTSCSAETVVEHPMSLCERCGCLVLGAEECDAASRRQRVAALREQLAGSTRETLVIATDRAQRDELRHQLGLAVLDQEEGSLWDGRTTRQAFGHDVVGLDELCGRATPECRILLDHLPSDARLLRALVLRLSAAGWNAIGVEVLDHPLQWHSDRPARRDAPRDAWGDLAGRRLRWEAGRAEIEFRYTQALAELRRELHRLGRARGGSFFADATVRRGSASHAALLEALHTDDPGRRRILAEDAELFARAQHWIGEAIDRCVERGLGLDPPRSARLLLSELDESPLLARRIALLLAWARRERLLSATDIETGDRGEVWALSERLRHAPKDQALELDISDVTPTGPTRQVAVAAEEESLAPGIYLSLAGTGRTRALQEVARQRSAQGDRVLCVVPETGSLLGWGEVAHRVPELEVMTAVELAVAILSEVEPEADAASPRPLPPAGSVAGEEIRQGLLREVSRLYAQRSGRVPALDSRALRRLLEEDGAVERMASAGADVEVDAEVLRDCIREARLRHGWLEEGDLFAIAAERIAQDEELAQKWRRHFDGLLLDDAHALDDAAADLMERAFTGIPRWAMVDPWLVRSDAGMQPFRKGRAKSQVPRNIAAALEVLTRNLPVAGWKWNLSRTGARGELRKERILNLEACVRQVSEFARGRDLSEASLAVVLGHENDRRQMILRLREEGHRIWDAEVLSRYSAPGPRDLLALGFLVFETDLDDARRTTLLDLVLRNTRWDFSDLARPADLDDEVTGLADCVAAAVHALRDFVDAEQPMREFYERARHAGLLDATLSRTSSRRRLEEFLTLAGSRAWFELRHQVDVEALDHPRRATGAIWCLRPRDLHGRTFDHLFHVCSGFEEAARHVLVASRARKSLTVLYSETDPLPRNA